MTRANALGRTSSKPCSEKAAWVEFTGRRDFGKARSLGKNSRIRMIVWAASPIAPIDKRESIIRSNDKDRSAAFATRD